MPEVKWDVVKNLGVLSEGAGGWKKEVNIVIWNERKPKIDVRAWNADHQKMGKGITLNKDEIKKLKEILDKADVDTLEIE